MDDEGTEAVVERRLERDLARVLDDVSRKGEPLSVVVLALDELEEREDPNVRGFDDRSLSLSAPEWTRALRAGDLIARTSADQFVIVLPDCSADAAQAVGRRLCSYMPSRRSPSIGTVSWDGSESAGELLTRATDAERMGGASIRRQLERRPHPDRAGIRRRRLP